MKKVSKFISLMLILVICVTMTGITSYATSIDELKDGISDLKDEAGDIQDELDELESLKNDIDAYITEIDSDLNEVSMSIYNLELEYDDVEEKLEDTQKKLAEQQESVDEQYASMKLRIQFMYENGDTEYISMLFGSTDLSDFLNNVEYVSELAAYDRQMLVKLEETLQAIEESEQELLAYEDELETLIAEKNAEQEKLETLLAAKEEELENYNTQIASAEDELSDVQSEIAAQQEELKMLEEAESRHKAEEESSRKAAAAAAATSSSSSSTASSDGGSTSTGTVSSSGFIWPCPSSHSISSYFGNRESPTAGASSYHQGIDIRASYGSAIVAAASGTVEWANYSSSAGYWIGIYHGNGTYTVYMHCSSLLVSAGATVSQGQTIALVGSTGYSTGNHLHFGVRINGTYVNPLNYVS